MDLIDQIAFHIQDWWSELWRLLGHYHAGDWFIILPMFFCTEAPFFLAAAFILDIQGERQLAPDERQRRLAFLETRPLISVLLVAQDDDAAHELPRVLRSWCELDQPGIELLLIDNSPGDAVSRAFNSCAHSEQVRLWRQTSGVRDRRRGSVFNLALQLAVGKLLICADARSSCDHDVLLQLIGPFHNPQIGAVTGSCKAVNGPESNAAALQALEMLLVYGLRKRLLGRWRLHTQGTTVFGAYRRECMERIGAFEPELTDGLDLALKIQRCGWQSLHAPLAVVTLRVSEGFGATIRERLVMDRELASALLRRHLHPGAWSTRSGMALLLTQLSQGILLPLGYAVLTLWLLLSSPLLLLPVLLVLWLINALCLRLAWSTCLRMSERPEEERPLAGWIPFLPPWFMVLRLIRIQALIWAILRRLRHLLRRRSA